jgi:hypothetical protein
MSKRASGFTAAFAVVIGIWAGTAEAVAIVSDFEPGGTYYGGDEAWFGYGMQSVAQESSPPGGTGNWLRASPNQYYGQMTNQSWANPDISVGTFNNHSHLEFDLIVDNSWLPNASTPLTIEFQFGGGTSGTVNKYKTVNFNSATKQQVIHLDADYSTFGSSFDPTSTFWNLSFETHPGYDWGWDGANPSSVPYATKFWIDNVQLTGAPLPEPASLGLVLLGGLALARRSR